jgi:hypothetical protein
MFVATTTGDLADASLPVSSYVERWKPEIDACLEVTFYALSTSYKASPGMKAFGFSYSKKGNPYVLAVLIACKWFYCRLHRISIYKNWRAAAEGSLAKQLWRMIKVLDAVMQIFSFANHISFLSAKATSESYPDLTSRLSGYGYAPRSSSSQVSDSHSNSLVANAPIVTSTDGSGSGSGGGGGMRGGGVSRAEGQLAIRHQAWQAVQGLALALALLYDWQQLATSARRYAIDLYFRSLHFLNTRMTLSSVGNSFLIQKYIPEFLLRFLRPSSGSVSSDGAGGAVVAAAAAAASAATKDSDPCAICGLHPPEVSLVLWW